MLSYLSVFYGTTCFNAHVLYDNRPKISNVIKILIIDFLYIVLSYFILFLFTDYSMIYLAGNNWHRRDVKLNLLYIVIFILVMFFNNMLQLKRFCYLYLANVNISGTIGTFPYMLFKGKHTLKDVLEMRRSYSSWILIYLFSFVSMKSSMCDSLNTFESTLYYKTINFLFTITLILSLSEYIAAHFFDTLIFKWAFDISDESVNNIDNSESVEIV